MRSTSIRRVFVATTAGVALTAAMAGGTIGPAGAAELEDLRSSAQTLADEVTSLEHRLESLGDRAATLEAGIAAASRDIGVIELTKGDAEAAYDAAMDRFVSRAVEAYKTGPSARLGLLLSATTMDQLFTLARATGEAADSDAAALAELLAAKSAAEHAQEMVDARKQQLLTTRARVETVSGEIRSLLERRRSALAALTDRVDTLEEQARRAAARAARPTAALRNLLAPSGPAPGIPKGFAGTGVTFGGISSWYGPGFEGNPTASGAIFDPDLFTAASKELPLGTWLYVTHAGKGVVVLVNDRGPYVEGRILDLSQAAAEAIGISGLGWIEAEIVVPVKQVD